MADRNVHHLSKHYLDYFKFPDILGKKFVVTCITCNKSLQATYRAKTSNAKAHLKSVHHEKFVELETLLSSEREEALPARSAPQPRIDHHFTVDKSRVQKYTKSDPRQKLHTEGLVRIVAELMLPLSFVEAPSVREAYHNLEPEYQMPTRKHLTNTLIPQRDEAISTKLSSLLSEASSICLTLDMWSNRQIRSYIGITCHFVHNWEAHSAMLACQRFKGKHTGDNIRTVYDDIITKYGIGDKISAIVTDNGANVVKAFALPGIEETDNNEADNSTEEIDEPSAEEEEHHRDMIESEIMDKEHLRCACHTLQLVVKDGLKKCPRSALAKSNVIIKHARNHASSVELLEANNKNKPQIANATRWSSQLTALESLLNLGSTTITELDCPITLSSDDLRALSDIVTILQPFRKATKMLEGDTATAGHVIPVMRLLSKEVYNIKSKLGNSPLLDALSISMETRLDKFTSDTDIYILCSFVDPRFKLNWCRGMERDRCRDTVISTMRPLSNYCDIVSEDGPAET